MLTSEKEFEFWKEIEVKEENKLLNRMTCNFTRILMTDVPT
jgi:hypothetical protein